MDCLRLKQSIGGVYSMWNCVFIDLHDLVGHGARGVRSDPDLTPDRHDQNSHVGRVKRNSTSNKHRQSTAYVLSSP